MINNKKSYGFTIIELIVVILIVSILTGLSLAYFNTSTKERVLEQEAHKLADVLNLAKSKAQAGDRSIDCTEGDGFVGYDVTLDDVQNYYLEFLCSKSSTIIQNYTIDGSIELSSTTGSAVVFKALGVVDGTTTPFIFTLRSPSLQKCINVTITNVGLIYESAKKAC